MPNLSWKVTEATDPEQPERESSLVLKRFHTSLYCQHEIAAWLSFGSFLATAEQGRLPKLSEAGWLQE